MAKLIKTGCEKKVRRGVGQHEAKMHKGVRKTKLRLGKP